MAPKTIDEMKEWLTNYQVASDLIKGSFHRYKKRFKIYVDSYRLFLIAKNIANNSRERNKSIYHRLGRKEPNLTITPTELASVAYKLFILVEQKVVKDIERTLQSTSAAVIESSELFHLIRKLAESSDFPIPAQGLFVDSPFESYIFAPATVDRVQLKKRYLSWAKTKFDKDREWLERHAESIDFGRLPSLGKDPADFTDFGKLEDFANKLADKKSVIGSFSGIKLVQGGQRDKFLQFKEKGVDADLIISVMDDLYDDSIDVCAFFTNDTDFAPLFERIKKEGKQLYLAGNETKEISRRLLEVIGKEQNFIDISKADVSYFDDVWDEQLLHNDINLIDHSFELMNYDHSEAEQIHRGDFESYLQLYSVEDQKN